MWPALKIRPAPLCTRGRLAITLNLAATFLADGTVGHPTSSQHRTASRLVFPYRPLPRPGTYQHVHPSPSANPRRPSTYHCVTQAGGRYRHTKRSAAVLGRLVHETLVYLVLSLLLRCDDDTPRSLRGHCSPPPMHPSECRVLGGTDSRTQA
jgi:hypothetical protein